MTVREYLDRRERPYQRDAKVCMAIFVLGAVAMTVAIEAEAPVLVDGEYGWKFWGAMAAALLYLVGGVGVFIAAILKTLRVRCPQCNGRLRSRTKHWGYCPLCGVSLGAELPDQAKAKRSSQPSPAA